MCKMCLVVYHNSITLIDAGIEYKSSGTVSFLLQCITDEKIEISNSIYFELMSVSKVRRVHAFL